MRKILSFIAIATIALSMASCGGNEPSQKEFQFQISALSGKARITIISADKDKFFVFAVRPYAESEGDIETVVQNYMSVVQERSYESLSGLISKERATMNSNSLAPNNQYIVMACYVEKDEETGKAKLIGDIAFKEFKTMPEYTLPGEFSVSATKKVHFSTGNAYQTEAGFTIRIQEEQWKRYGSSQSYPRDLFQWGTTKMLANTFFIPSADEWYYLFRERPNADELFAHAKVNNVDGIIILPDDWKEPEELHVKSCKEMEMEWDEATHTYAQGETFDGYAQNVFGLNQWSILEFYGAVFLPFTWEWSGMNVAWYWSATEDAEYANGAHALNFYKYWLYLKSLKATSMEKTGHSALRPVRILE